MEISSCNTVVAVITFNLAGVFSFISKLYNSLWPRNKLYSLKWWIQVNRAHFGGKQTERIRMKDKNEKENGKEQWENFISTYPLFPSPSTTNIQDFIWNAIFLQEPSNFPRNPRSCRFLIAVSYPPLLLLLLCCWWLYALAIVAVVVVEIVKFY